MRVRLGVIWLAAIVAGAALPALSNAQTQQQQSDWCMGKGGASPDQKIGGCTALMNSGRFTGKTLANILYNRGGAYYAKKDYDRAIAEYNQAIRLNPEFSNAISDRGAAYYSKNDYDHAIADQDLAIRLNPNDALAINNRGNAYRAKGDNDRAIADFDQAIRLNPKYVTAYYSRGLAWETKGNRDRAIADYTEANRLDPTYSNAINRLNVLKK